MEQERDILDHPILTSLKFLFFWSIAPIIILVVIVMAMGLVMKIIPLLSILAIATIPLAWSWAQALVIRSQFAWEVPNWIRNSGRGLLAGIACAIMLALIDRGGALTIFIPVLPITGIAFGQFFCLRKVVDMARAWIFLNTIGGVLAMVLLIVTLMAEAAIFVAYGTLALITGITLLWLYHFQSIPEKEKRKTDDE